MCKELEDELDEGRHYAEGLVSHIERMGAAKAILPTQGADCSVWRVTVERIGGIKEDKDGNS